MLRGIRGAITVSENTEKAITESTIDMLKEIIDQNKLNIKDIACANFSMTKDLNCIYPAKVAREYFDFAQIPMMCYQELDINNSLEKCIRVLLLVNSDKEQNEFKHIYLNDAKKLRPDIK